VRKTSRREGKNADGLPRGTAGFGAGPSPLKLKPPGGSYRIRGARGYAAGGKGIFSPVSLLIAGSAGGGAVAAAILQRTGVLDPLRARWVLYGGVILAGLIFLWEGRRRLMDDSRRKKGRSPGKD